MPEENVERLRRRLEIWDPKSAVAYVWTFRDGRVVHIKGFFDPAEALEAAGLSD